MERYSLTDIRRENKTDVTRVFTTTILKNQTKKRKQESRDMCIQRKRKEKEKKRQMMKKEGYETKKKTNVLYEYCVCFGCVCV